MEFKYYNETYYEAVCDFLIELNRKNQNHINWNWARFEWMYEHPEFDISAKNKIGLWTDHEKIVGAAIYDMYFGEAFCGALPEYGYLYPEILEYAYHALKDESGLAISVCDDNAFEIKTAEDLGFFKTEQDETLMCMELKNDLSVNLPEGLHFTQIDPAREPYEFQWLLWQGFDHGTDRAKFEKEERIAPQIRRHFDPFLSVAVENEAGEKVSYCCLWYSEKTDYAYVEPVCTVPFDRGKGIAKALICEAINRAGTLGAKRAYVLSDMEFYHRLGFAADKHFTFYHKK